MADDTYPFPLDPLPVDQLAAYEEAVLRLFNSWIEGHGGSVHGLAGVLLSVDIDRQEPTTRLRFHYRSHAEGEFDAYASLGSGYPPEAVFSINSSSWEDGSLRADEDPRTLAVQRQKQAMPDWRAAYPDAAAAVPSRRPNAVEEQRAEWGDWGQRFPDAAARRPEVMRPIREFLE